MANHFSKGEWTYGSNSDWFWWAPCYLQMKFQPAKSMQPQFCCQKGSCDRVVFLSGVSMQATDVSMCSLCRKNILAHDFMTDVGGTACQDVKSICAEYELQTRNGICHYACLFYVCVYMVSYIYMHTVSMYMYIYIYIHVINICSPHAPDSTHYKSMYIYICIYIRIYGLVFRVPTPPHPNGMGPQVPPLPFYLQAIGSISEVHPRIC